MDNDKIVNVTISDFKKTATLNKIVNSKIDVYIAQSKIDNKMYVVNAFTLNNANKSIFKDFFYLLRNNPKQRILSFLLTDTKNFYVIFEYSNTKAIDDIFSAEKNIYNYTQRCEMVEKILLVLSKNEILPGPALACCSCIHNVGIDEINDVVLCYNLESYFKYSNNSKEIIYKNISEIISELLRYELKENKIPFMGFYNQPYRTLLQKCEAQLYNNIPELIIEFQKAEKLCNMQDTRSAATKYLNDKKKRLMKYVRGGIILLLIAALVYMFAPLLADKNKVSTEVITIGAYTYNKNAAETEAMLIGDPPLESEPPTDYSGVSLPPHGANITYEEYIVKYGDTVKSICTKQYNNEALENAVKTFNNIQNPDNLEAGSIVKLPSVSIIEQYVTPDLQSKSSEKNASSQNRSGLEFIY